jgi:phosphoribosylanthranilate isomerase
MPIAGVFVDETLDNIRRAADEAGLDCVQLHGDEDPSFCEAVAKAIGLRVIKALRVRRGGHGLSGLAARYNNVSACLLDTYVEGRHGGTGEAFDWETAIEASRSGRIILSGGLTPDNVGEAVTRVRPKAVDASSGVESGPGRKDAAKVSRFVEAAKKAP